MTLEEAQQFIETLRIDLFKLKNFISRIKPLGLFCIESAVSDLSRLEGFIYCMKQYNLKPESDEIQSL